MMIKLQAEKARLNLLEPPELLTTGMQRAVMCKLIFGPAWDGLHKTAVFRAGDVVRDVPEENWEEGACPIPPEVLRKAGLTVLIGVYGTDCDRVVLPTVWCSLGAVRAGANPSGDPSAEESLPVWEGLRREISNNVARIEKLEKKPTQSALYTELSRKRTDGEESCLLQAPRAVAMSADGDYRYSYKQITDVSQLKEGDFVVIAAANANCAISTDPKSNNRAQAAIQKNPDNTINLVGNVARFTVGSGTYPNTYSFYDIEKKGYLCAASSEANYLRTQDALDDNASWDISIASNGEVTLTARGNFTRNVMRYNSTSKLFSCYDAGNEPLALYASFGSVSFGLVKSEEDITSGQYVLMVKAGGPYHGSYTYYALKKETINGSYVAAYPVDAFLGANGSLDLIISDIRDIVWTLTGGSACFTLTDGGAKCLYNVGNPLYYNYKEGDLTKWSAVHNPDTGAFQIYSNDRYLGLLDETSYSTGDKPRFRCSGSTAPAVSTSSSFQFYVYAMPKYRVSWQQPAEGSVLVTADGQSLEGGEAASAFSLIHVAPQDGYRITAVTCNGEALTVTDGICSFYLTENAALDVALEAVPTYPVTWSVDPQSTYSGQISATVDGVAIANGDEVTENRMVRLEWNFCGGGTAAALISKLLVNGVDRLAEIDGVQADGPLSLLVEESIEVVATIDAWAAPNLLVVDCHGLEAGEQYALHLYTVSRHSGRTYGKWRHPANHDAERPTYKIGYGVYASETNKEVPEWMPNGGFLQTEWPIDPETKEVIIDLRKWLLPMAKPDGSGKWAGLMGVAPSVNAPILLQFRLVRLSDGYVGECRQTLAVGPKMPEGCFAASPAMGEVRMMYTSIR